MISKESSYQELRHKLDQFIRKYYTNQLIRGSIFSAVYVLVFFMAINVVEYYLYLPPYLRKILFFGFLFSSAAFVIRFAAVPLLHYYRLGKIISYEQAAQIIGTHFADVKDKLLNLLQLRQAATSSESALLLAAVDQKAIALRPIDFSFAIDLRKNRKYLRYLLPPLALFLFIIIAAPNVIKEGTRRLYHNDTFYEKEAPFRFVLKNKSLKALQFETYALEATTEGEALPAEMYVETGGNTFKMRLKEKGLFAYDFVNLQKTVTFRLQANGFRSQEFTLEVVAKPLVAEFEVMCDYPAYTRKPDEVVKNLGDLLVPEGTKLSWHFYTRNTTSVRMLEGDSTYTARRSSEETFSITRSARQSMRYTIKVSNGQLADADSASYSLSVTPDLYPVIAVTERNDSASGKYFYYIGEVSDDYGIRQLTFNYQLSRADSAAAAVNKSIDVPVAAGASSRFTYYWSLSDFGIRPGDKLTYYFEVWDNDGIHGSKSTRSSTMVFEMPSLSELNRQVSKDNKELKNDLKETMENARELKQELKAMQDKMLEKQNLNWEDKKNLQETLEKQKALEEQIKELQEKMNQNFEKQNEFKEVSEAIKEKQKNLQELMDKTLDEETRKLMEKLEKMLEELQKKDAVEKMQDMQMSNDKLEKELDRMLELFKKLEFQQKLEETAKKLEELAEKQEDLAERQEKQQDGKESKDAQQLKEQQQKLKEELKEAKKDLEELKKLNEETKSDQDFKEAEQSLNNAEKQMEDAAQNQDQKQNSKASQNQKNAAQNMKNASQKLSDMKMQMEQDQMAEDMQAIRQLLENIVQLSFDEEKLMNEVKATNINSPKYVSLMKEQQRIRENSRMVEDSLYALAKRQESIKSFITKEITNVNKYIARSISDMEDRNVIKATADQQFVMTGYNNLALMLSEALQQMQEQMSESQQKSSGQPKNCMKCKKPGQGMPNLSKMQQQLKDKMSQMAEMMKKEGQGQKSGQGTSKAFAEMARMQQQIRKELERLGKEQNKDGRTPGGSMGEAIRQMEETEKNLVNKQLTAEMLKRQQDILNKLLEAENAERQREQQPERESQSGKEKDRKLPPSLEEYLKARQSETDFYKTVPPGLKPYYKNMAEQYFRNITIGQ